MAAMAAEVIVRNTLSGAFFVSNEQRENCPVNRSKTVANFQCDLQVILPGLGREKRI